MAVIHLIMAYCNDGHFLWGEHPLGSMLWARNAGNDMSLWNIWTTIGLIGCEITQNIIKFDRYLRKQGIHWLLPPVAELILGLRLANERRRYFVTTFLIGWAQA